MDKWRASAFDDAEEDPLGPLANLVDLILVFACGLVAALVAYSPDLQQHFGQSAQRDITLGRELPTVPESIDRARSAGRGYESMGQVYRDPETGKLILIGP